MTEKIEFKDKKISKEILDRILEATYSGIDNVYKTNFNMIDKLEKEFELDTNIRPVSLIFRI